ncbi:MAG: hypothetical protein OXI39_05935 [Gemmatimonadota bacterium]|uniref:hypothetical protein n=1 Tax=Candidatus Palauibacter scopulicola TaxID=3056741 RepID=UPI00238D5B96|nr:hypothetical protein [Candidatus Palauibacter scopulicola]MDE2662528.1 hypothetical protein [Candidatus Palauibacter scopulicola]
MPESGGPDRQREVERLLDRLSRAAGRVETHWEEARVVRTSGPATPDIEERFKAVTAENRRLRELLAKAREKAVRLRNRLAHVEDEV